MTDRHSDAPAHAEDLPPYAANAAEASLMTGQVDAQRPSTALFATRFDTQHDTSPVPVQGALPPAYVDPDSGSDLLTSQFGAHIKQQIYRRSVQALNNKLGTRSGADGQIQGGAVPEFSLVFGPVGDAHSDCTVFDNLPDLGFGATISENGSSNDSKAASDNGEGKGKSDEKSRTATTTTQATQDKTRIAFPCPVTLHVPRASCWAAETKTEMLSAAFSGVQDLLNRRKGRNQDTSLDNANSGSQTGGGPSNAVTQTRSPTQSASDEPDRSLECPQHEVLRKTRHLFGQRVDYDPAGIHIDMMPSDWIATARVVSQGGRAHLPTAVLYTNVTPVPGDYGILCDPDSAGSARDRRLVETFRTKYDHGETPWDADITDKLGRFMSDLAQSKGSPSDEYGVSIPAFDYSLGALGTASLRNPRRDADGRMIQECVLPLQVTLSIRPESSISARHTDLRSVMRHIEAPSEAQLQAFHQNRLRERASEQGADKLASQTLAEDVSARIRSTGYALDDEASRMALMIRGKQLDELWDLMRKGGKKTFGADLSYRRPIKGHEGRGKDQISVAK